MSAALCDCGRCIDTDVDPDACTDDGFVCEPCREAGASCPKCGEEAAAFCVPCGVWINP